MSIAIITPSFARDFESCRLLCDSMDRFATGYTQHHVVVPHEDVAQFAVLAGPQRQVVSERELLRSGLVTLPMKRRGRRYFWAPWLRRPIYGWHTQQLRKIAMTLAQPAERVLHVDSDNCFLRPFDAGQFAEGPVPLYRDPGVVGEQLPQHVQWLRNAHLLLGLAPPLLPGDDYVGQMIVWEKASVARMVQRIEAVTGRPWLRAVAGSIQFSEYMLYGAAVTGDAELLARHAPVTQSPCLAYWEGPPLDAQSLPAFAARLAPHQRAIAVQSFIGTPVELIRGFALGRG